MAKYRHESAAGYIENALFGDIGPSSGVRDRDIGRGQSIREPSRMPSANTGMGLIDVRTTDDDEFGGGITNVRHSLTNTSSVNDEIGTAGRVKHTRDD